MASTMLSLRRAGSGQRSVRRRTAPLVAGLLALVAASMPVHAETGFANISKFHTPSWGTNLNAATNFTFASRVWSVVENNNIAYLGGDFSSMAPSLELAGAIDATSGLPQPGFPHIQGGQVQVAVPDDAGGWYIGGDFTSIDNITRFALARVRANGDIDTNFNPQFPKNQGPVAVYALAKRGPRLYVGGSFADMQAPGVQRNLALVSASSGLVDSAWSPDPDGVVRALAVSPDQSRIYAAGDFTALKGGAVPRNHLAAIAAEGAGDITGWAPQAGGTVAALVVSRDNARVYAGGNNVLGNSPLAAFDSGAGSPIPGWNPGAGGAVRSIALSRDDTTLFAGGEFTNLGGQARAHVAAVDAGSGALDRSWNPGADNQVNAVTVSEDGTKLYLGGTFTHVRGKERNKLAAVDTATGALDAWNPNSNGDVTALSVSGGQVYAGGNFTGLGDTPRTRLAAVDLTNGGISTWHPVVGSKPDTLTGAPQEAFVQAMALSADRRRLFVGGKFDWIGRDGVCNPATGAGCAQRTNLATVDLATGEPDAGFEPGALQGIVRGMAVYRDMLYVGGDFESIRVSKSGLSNPNRADANSGPLCDATKPNGGRCWDRSLIAAFNANTGELDQTFVPPAAVDPGFTNNSAGNPIAGVTKGEVKGIGIAVDGSKMWISGSFGGVVNNADQAAPHQAGMYVADRVTGRMTPWQPQIGIPIFGVETWDGDPAGNVAFTAGGGAGGKIHRFDYGHGPRADNPKNNWTWMHTFDGDSVKVDSSPTSVYSAGHYDFVDKTYRRKHASAYDLNGNISQSWDPEFDTPEGPFEVRVVPGKYVLYGGDFTKVNRRPQPGFAIFEGNP